MRKVRIKTIPKAQSGLDVKMKEMTSGRGMIAGLGLNSNTMPWPVMAGQLAEPNIEVNTHIKGVPREEANLEAEKGETAFTDKVGDGIPQLYKIGGKRHYNGGTPLDLPEDSFIYSRDKKMKIGGPILESFGKHKDTKDKFTPADLSKQYDINEYRKVLADPNTDKLQRDTAELMITNYNLKLGKLGLVQESKKGFPDGIPKIAMPFIETMQVDPTQFMMQNPQGQGPQGMTEQPAADNTARYGGMPKKQTGGPTIDDLYNAQQKLIPYIHTAGVADSYDKLEKQIQARKAKGETILGTTGAPSKTEPTGWYDAQGKRIDTPAQGSSGYWNHVTQNWKSNVGVGSDWRNEAWMGTGIDPSTLHGKVKTKAAVATQTAVDKLNPANAHGVLDYAGNLLSMPQKGVNLALTGNYETPGTTYLRNNPNNTGTALMLDIVADPMNLVGVAELKAGAKLVAKVAPIVGEATIKALSYVAAKAPEVAKYVTDLVVKYGPKILENPYIQNMIRTGVVKGVQENSSTPQDKASIQEQWKNINEGISPVAQAPTTIKPKVLTPVIATPQPQAQFTNGKVQAIAPAGVDTTVVPEADTTDAKAQRDYEAWLQSQKKALGGGLLKAQLGVTFKPDGKGNMISIATGKPIGPDPTFKKPVKGSSTKVVEPTMGTYTPSIMDMLNAKQNEGYDILAPETKSTGIERLSLQHQQKNMHNLYGDVQWTPEQLADFKRRQSWVFDKKPDFSPNDATVVGTWTEDVGKHKKGDPMTKGQSDTLWFQKEFDKQLPGYFGGKEQGTGYDAAMGEHTFSAPGLVKKEIKPADKAVEDPTKSPFEHQDLASYQTPGPEWWLQDKVKTAGAFADLMRIKKYNPWQATPGAYLPEGTFYDPTRELAANAEQVNLGVQGASTFSGPQSFAATAGYLQGQGARNVADIMGKYNNLNVTESNRLGDETAAVLNQGAQQRAANATQLFDKQTIVNQQFDNAKNEARQNLRQGFIDALTNRANTYNLNTMFPQYAVSAENAGMIVNPRGSNRATDAETLARNARSQQQDSRAYMDELIGKGYTPEQINRLYDTMYGKGRSGPSSEDAYTEPQGPQKYPQR